MNGGFPGRHSACFFRQMCQRKEGMLDVTLEKKKKKGGGFMAAFILYVSNETKEQQSKGNRREPSPGPEPLLVPSPALP